MDAEGVQILLYPLAADRPRGDRRRTHGRPASAARCAHQSRRALYGEDRDRGGVLQRRRRTRHPAIPHRLRREFRARRGGQALQSACDDRRRNRKILERNAGGAIPLVHVLAGGRVGLSAWLFWHSSEGAESANAVALRAREQSQTIAATALTA